MNKYKKAFKKPLVEIAGALLLIGVFVLPFLSFASSRNNIYVDGSKSGKEEGSVDYPYHTISEALVHANDRTDVHVAKGNYEDNIEIPKGVKIFGSGTDEVIITARSHKKVVVSMKDDTEINKLTVKDGNQGVWIKKDAKASIIDCVIRDNDKDGIKIESGSTKKSRAISITDSVIKNNGRAGIYSQKHRLVLINNEISDNDSDGVDIAAGSSAWIEKNKIKDNDGSGIRLSLDDSDIWTKSNTYRSNGHSGLEIDAYGASGRVDVNKSKFIDNGKYGVSRVSRANVSANVWKGFTIQDNNTFEQTKQGNVSSILRIN